MNTPSNLVTGRFAPSPTGRMHLGNIFTALVSWLAAKSAGGRWILRIEDLDPQRSRPEYARLIEDDLHWLGLIPDEGGYDAVPPCRQSARSEYYERALDRLIAAGRVYPCTCTKADIRAVAAPHDADRPALYPGTCRPAVPYSFSPPSAPHSLRLMVDPGEISFIDGVFGLHTVNPYETCGDFVLRRADGAWAYQLAVVVDDDDMGVNQVVRGCDLLDSACQQILLYRLLGLAPPAYIHLPLICNASGRRLSKRDPELDMAHLRERFSPKELVGRLAHLAGLIDSPESCSPGELLGQFDIHRIPRSKKITLCQLK